MKVHPEHTRSRLATESSSIETVRGERKLNLVTHKGAADVWAATAEAGGLVGGEVPTLFFIHGVGGSMDTTWAHQLDYFADYGYSIVCFDFPGHGKSPRLATRNEYCFHEVANDVLSIFDKYSASEINIVIGHSYGTSFCTYLASRRASKIRGLVLVSGGGPYILSPSCSPVALPTSLLTCARPLVELLYKSMAVRSRLPKNMRSACRLDTDSFSLRSIMLGQVWLGCDEKFHQNLRVPVLQVAGEHDRFVDFDDEQCMHEYLKFSKLVVLSDAGHMVTLERPAYFNTVVHDWCRTNSGQTPTNILNPTPPTSLHTFNEMESSKGSN